MNTRACGISMDSYLSMLGFGALFSIQGLLVYILFKISFCMHAWPTRLPFLPLFSNYAMVVLYYVYFSGPSSEH
jgi:hypothetical protein